MSAAPVVVESATRDAARSSVNAAHGETLRRVMGYLMQRENAALLVCRGAQSAAGQTIPAAEVFGLQQLALQAIVAAAGSHSCGVRPLLLGGDAGSGKSTVLAHTAHTCEAAIPVARVVHQVATGCTLHATLTRLWLALDHSSPPPLAEQELCAAMPAMLTRAAARLQPVLIFLDGIDQHSHGSEPGTPSVRPNRGEDWVRRALRWVPSPLPAGVRLVCTVSTDCPGWDTLSCEQVLDEQVQLTWPPPEETVARVGANRKWVVGTVTPLPLDASLLLMREWSGLLDADIEATARLENLARRFSNPFQLRLQLVRELLCSAPKDCAPEDAQETICLVFRHFEDYVGMDAARGCLQLLRVACAGGLEEVEISLVLARQGVHTTLDSTQANHIFIPELELLLDSVRSSGSPNERKRLNSNDIVQLAAQARYGRTDTPEAITWLAALAEHLKVSTKSSIEDRATRLLPVLQMLVVHATKGSQDDAIRQAHASMLTAAFDPAIVSWLFERGQTEALLQYCLSSGGYDVVCEYVLSLPQSLIEEQADMNESILNLGRLLSTAGQYVPARELLQRAVGQLEAQAVGSEVTAEMQGRLQLALAENEVRYWDSRRDWTSESDLELLLSSSTEAVAHLRRAGELLRQKLLGRPACASSARTGRGSTITLRLCDALSRCANAHFKAGCVLTGEAASHHFDLADTMTDEVERLIGSRSGFAPSETLAGAWLVSGVTTSCRAHLLKRLMGTQETAPDLRMVAKSLLNRAVELFLRAESMLVQCVGEFNEKSIYTHSNLGEIYVYDFHNVRQGLVHLRRSCDVAERIFGVDHPCAQAKRKQIQSITDQLMQMQMQHLLGLDEQLGGAADVE